MELKIEKLDNYGRGIAYFNDKICFVENALPGEIVQVEIEKEYKKYIEAKVISYKKVAPNRIKEECPYSNVCGGCQLNHICYDDENKFKEEKVRDILKKFTNISTNIIKPIAFHERDYYRNKIILHGKDGVLGLYQKKSNEIIPIVECLLVNPKINKIIHLLNEANNGIDEAIIKTSNDNNQVMISVKGKVRDSSLLLQNSDVFILNGKYISQKKCIETQIGNKVYQEGIDSFFQVNNTLTKSLYDEVFSQIKGKNYQNVLDLYCGTGTIGIYVSSECQKVIGIDCNISNVLDAKNNKILNQINNIEFIYDKVENQIDKIKDIDVIIVDPPRAGLDKKTIHYLKKINPVKIIYVSCDPITLARDLKDLSESYDIKYIRLFNMFPRTYHVETVSVLTRRN